VKECAFCTHTGKLSAEHIFAEWVRELFPGKKNQFYIGGPTNRNERFESEKIDWNAKVVCGNCNNTWMNDIENIHGKPVLTPFITGEIGMPITQEMARSIAIYAFKTAVVANHAARSLQPYFSARLRHAFRVDRSLPAGVSIWICGIKHHRGNVEVKTNYYATQLSPTYRTLMYTFTCGIGFFVVQVVYVKQFGQVRFRPLAGFEDIGIPVWPAILPDATWPGRYVLDGSREDFEGFSDRWARIQPISE
jgi:hypothetical protein